MIYRFRLEGELLVLQVGEYVSEDSYGYSRHQKLKWRDATVGDIPLRDPFARDPLPAYPVESGSHYTVTE